MTDLSSAVLWYCTAELGPWFKAVYTADYKWYDALVDLDIHTT